jgi:hypothetical protein
MAPDGNRKESEVNLDVGIVMCKHIIESIMDVDLVDKMLDSVKNVRLERLERFVSLVCFIAVLSAIFILIALFYCISLTINRMVKIYKFQLAIVIKVWMGTLASLS